jgi:hypothetical protein
MVAVDTFGAGSFIALLIGAVLVIGGLYARRHGKLRNRQGAALLAGFAALIGVVVLGVGVYALLKA